MGDKDDLSNTGSKVDDCKGRGSGIHLALVMPPQHGLLAGFANALISLANYVRQKSPEVQVHLVDLSEASCNRIEQELCELQVPNSSHLVVGITTTTASYQAALDTAQAAKSTYPSCTVLFGGHHVTGDPETVLQAHEETVDYALLGEGERSLVEFLETFPNVEDVSGLAYVEDGTFHRNAPPRLLGQDELDSLPATYGGNTEFGSTGKFQYEVTYVSARGCPLNCAFCAVGNQLIRHKSTEQIARDVRSLVNEGYRRIAIEDNFFAHSRSRTKKLCGRLAELRDEGLEFSWDCQTRIESLNDEDVISIMAEGGCEAVFIGVESLSPEGLQYLNKTNDPSRYLRLLREAVVPLLLDSPITCNINLQFGLPKGEENPSKGSLDRLRDLGKLAQNADEKIVVYPQLHVVYPGTQHFKEGVGEGRFTTDVFESFTRWEAARQPILEWLGEHFAHGTGGLPEGILQGEKLRRDVFEVDADAVMRVNTVLRRVEEIPGIELFKYGEHLISRMQKDSADFSGTRRGKAIGQHAAAI